MLSACLSRRCCLLVCWRMPRAQPRRMISRMAAPSWHRRLDGPLPTSTGPSNSIRNTPTLPERGNANAAKGNLNGAIADFNRASNSIRIHQAYYNRGNAKQSKGDLDGAIADYNRVLELIRITPTLPEPRQCRASQSDLTEPSPTDSCPGTRPEYTKAYYNRAMPRKPKVTSTPLSPTILAWNSTGKTPCLHQSGVGKR